MERAGQRARGQEAAVQLEVLVRAGALQRMEGAVDVDDEDGIRLVDPDHPHLALGELVLPEEVDPAAQAAVAVPRASPSDHLASRASRRRSCASSSGTRATTGSRNPSTMNLRASSGSIPRVSR